MGCDIHMSVEVCGESGNWGEVPAPAGLDPWSDAYGIPEWYPYRCYSDFALLAGVRQRLPEIVPISEPRGLPRDVSDGVRAQAQAWDYSGHSHSWLTLGDLEAHAHRFDSAYIPDKLIPELRKCGAPDRVRIVFFFDS